MRTGVMGVAWLGRLAANSGAALTLGGTVLALAIAAGAVGLAEAQGKTSPWSNGWVRLGFVVAILAFVWTFAVFLVGMRVTLKGDRFMDQVGTAIAQGKGFRYGGGLATDIPPWVKRCRSLLEAGLGEGEGKAFVQKRQNDAVPEGDEWHFLDAGLARLVSILDRPYLRVRFDFDHRRDWMA